MPQSPTWKRRVIEWLVVVTIICVLVAILLPAVRLARNPNGPHGDPVPTEAPDERNRFDHESGISIVLPPNWDVKPDKPWLMIAPRFTPGRRMPAVLNVERLDHAPPANLDLMQPVTFQGRPALERMEIERKGRFDDPASSRYTLDFELGGTWWHVDYLIQDELEVLPEMMRRYIETIRFQTRMGTAADLGVAP